MTKKVFFYIDDVIWVYRDLTRQKPKSMFDNAYMAMLKKAHDDYGFKVQLNSFYRTDFFYGSDEFTLSEMTDAYKDEWKSNSDWLKIGFHAKQEFPDYPYVNGEYEYVKKDFQQIFDEVKRFASEDNIGYAVTPHWTVISRDGARALRDCGVRVITAIDGGATFEFNGDKSTLPYGHYGRYIHNKKPETKLFTRDTKDIAIKCSICSYNCIPKEKNDDLCFSLNTNYDENMGLHLKILNNTGALNLRTLDEVEDMYRDHINEEYIGAMTHEQYFYKDYFAYQPDYAEKLYKMAKYLTDNGYTFFFAHELADK